MNLLKGHFFDKVAEACINSLKFSLLRLVRGSGSYFQNFFLSFNL